LFEIRQKTHTVKGSYAAISRVLFAVDGPPSQACFVVARPQAAAAAIVVVVVSCVMENQDLLGCKRLPTKKKKRE